MAKFAEVFSDETKRGYKIPTSEYLTSGKHPIIDQGYGQIAGYADLESGAFTDVPAIIFGDHTRIVKYVDTPFFLGADGVKVLKIKTPNADYKYLFYFLQNAKIPNTGYNRHFKWLKELDVPLPSIDEQRRIAAILDKVTDLIAKRRAQLDKLDLLVKSRFVEMFGGINDSSLFPYVPIKEFTNVVSGATPNRGNSQYWDGGTIPWIKTTELRNDEIYDTEEKITEAGFENSSVKMVPAHTILIAMYGQGKTRGMTAYLQCQATTNQACACILPSKKVNQKYLWQYLIFSYEKLRNMAKGGNQPNLNGEIIKNFPVLIPPIEMQTKFSGVKEDVEKNKSLVIESLNALETLKASLMQQYFG